MDRMDKEHAEAIVEAQRVLADTLARALAAYGALADAIGRALEAAAEDDAQLANVDLQNILQKQQQTLQMMSNISKMLHDTAAAIIRKIGG
jgi:hypothetical protein